MAQKSKERNYVGNREKFLERKKNNLEGKQKNLPKIYAFKWSQQNQALLQRGDMF